MPDFRTIPSIERLRQRPAVRALEARFGAEATMDALRAAAADARAAIGAGDSSLLDEGAVVARVEGAAASRLAELFRPSLQPVINATGVIIHTNLGRAPLSDDAIAAMTRIARGYSNLEFDLDAGERGSRYGHCGQLLASLTGGEDAIVVNNNAAALLLVLQTFAAGREVVLSRGQLIEIGGGVRIPEVMEASGTRLVEVGTTNRTYTRDFERAITERTAALMIVHRSNFRISGYTCDPPITELAELARSRGLLLLDDLGSGTLLETAAHGLGHEPTVQERIAAGADLVCFSGDKLLGGPQAGIVVGTRAIVSRLKKNPWNRALRVDKFTIAALEATLTAYEAGTAPEVVPTLRLLTEPLAAVLARARRVLRGLGAEAAGRLAARVEEGRSQVGGGALPTVELPTAGVSLGATDAAARALDAALRTGDPPVVGRLVEDRLFLDCRTVLPAQVAGLVKAILAAARP